VPGTTNIKFRHFRRFRHFRHVIACVHVPVSIRHFRHVMASASRAAIWTDGWTTDDAGVDNVVARRIL
jgi:hypothetical protein